MTEEGSPLHHAVFIVRLSLDAAGRIGGVVERVRTGEKVRLDALSTVGQILAAMLTRGDSPGPGHERNAP